ncbi:dihydrofolate synthase / folylpolyglutamate synthase, partial [Candidatus Hakubella thermalkaliphila]
GEWVRTGLESFSIPGRLEMICSRPRVLVDGAHNPAAIQKLMENIKKGYSYSRLIIILALFKDKHASKMIKYLLPQVDVIFLSESGLPRSQDAEYLRTLVEKNHHLVTADKRIEVWVERDLARAVKKAIAMAKEQDLICVAGSLSNIWIAKKTVQDLTEEVFS